LQSFFKKLLGKEAKINTKEDIKDSKHFCIIPWLHLHALPDSRVLPCCVSDFDETYGNLNKESLKEVWNNSKFKTMRRLMLADRPVSSCSKCYELEESNVPSMRVRSNSKFSRHSDLIKNTQNDGYIENPKMIYLDFRFSNICNFKCRGCSPALSTKWYEDHQKLWDFKSDKPKLINVVNDNPNIWEELRHSLPDVEEAYFAGGEPLLMDEHYKCLDFFIEKNMNNVQLSYNTNLSILNFKKYDIISLWKKFENVSLMISIDDIEGRGEYFRSGLEWDNLLKNIEIVKQKLPHVYIHVNCTVNIFNISRLPEIHSYLFSKNIVNMHGFILNTLQDPIEYRSQALPQKLKDDFSKKLNNYANKLHMLFPMGDKNIQWLSLKQQIKNQIDFMNAEDLESKLGDFKKLTYKLDKIRDNNCEETFPELKEIFTK